MTDAPSALKNLAAAELRATRAREQLHLTVAQLQTRLDPRPRARRAAREAKVVGETAVAIAKDQPAATGGIAAGVAVVAGLFLARHHIARLFKRERPDTSPETSGLTPVTRTKS